MSHSDPDVDPTKSAVTTIDWIIRNPGAVASVAGVLAFAVLQLALRIYYSRFGLTPGEVGLSYGSILTQHETLLVMVAAVTVGIAIVLKRNASPLIADLRDLGQRIRGLETELIATAADVSLDNSQRDVAVGRLQTSLDALQRHRYRLRRNFTRTQRTLAVALILVPLSWAAVTIGIAMRSRNEVRQSSAFDPLQINTPRVLLQLITPTGFLRDLKGPELGLRRNAKFLLLGDNGGSLLLFDAVSRSVVRVERSNVVVVQER